MGVKVDLLPLSVSVFEISLVKASIIFYTEAITTISTFYQPAPIFYASIIFREREVRNLFCRPCTIFPTLYGLLLENIATH